jgi:hypothetical protein
MLLLVVCIEVLRWRSTARQNVIVRLVKLITCVQVLKFRALVNF